MSELDEKSNRPQFGGRLLEEGKDVFQHNAWDNVEWGEDQEREAEEAVAKGAKTLVSSNQAEEYASKAGEFWDKFYSIHQNRFFKERNWLFTEFPDLAPGQIAGRERVFESTVRQQEEKEESEENVDENKGSAVTLGEERLKLNEEVAKLRQAETYFGENSGFRLFEVGCGTGSSVFPVLEVNQSADLVVYCCDLSQQAVTLVREHREYPSGRCHAWVADVTADDWGAPFPPASLDVITLIFVLSAISPTLMSKVVKRMFTYLKPGGQVMFRDYGRYDLAQLRFKPGRCISDNFYARGDGTRCYFFTQEELRDLFVGSGFVEKQNLVDRRLQVNRGKRLKMYRVWLQAKYQKPLQ